MPTTKHKKQIQEKQRMLEARENGRWMCPSCKGIHHFNSNKGCHNQNCSFKGKLERLR